MKSLVGASESCPLAFCSDDSKGKTSKLTFELCVLTGSAEIHFLYTLILRGKKSEAMKSKG